MVSDPEHVVNCRILLVRDVPRRLIRQPQRPGPQGFNIGLTAPWPPPRLRQRVEDLERAVASLQAVPAGSAGSDGMTIEGLLAAFVNMEAPE